MHSTLKAGLPGCGKGVASLPENTIVWPHQSVHQSRATSKSGSLLKSLHGNHRIQTPTQKRDDVLTLGLLGPFSCILSGETVGSQDPVCFGGVGAVGRLWW